jgi:hypothetical protein
MFSVVKTQTSLLERGAADLTLVAVCLTHPVSALSHASRTHTLCPLYRFQLGRTAPLLVMRPHGHDFDGMNRFINLIHEPMLRIDPPSVRTA